MVDTKCQDITTPERLEATETADVSSRVRGNVEQSLQPLSQPVETSH